MNKDLLNKCGLLDWHKALFTGEGIRVAVFDDRPYLTDDMLIFAQTPFPADNANEVTHNTKVAKCLHEAAPNAQIFCLAANFGDIERNAKWITENNIDIISTSYSPFVVDDEKGVYKLLKESGIPLFASAGNDGKAELDAIAALAWTVAVGAAAYNTCGEIVLTNYSNYGEDLDCLSYIPAIEVEGRSFTPTGTSFAQPFAAGMSACYMQFLKEQKQATNRQSIRNFIRANAKDIYTQGKDIKSGYGILVMPQFSSIKEGKMILTKTELLLNGEEKEVETIQYMGHNYIKLRDLSDEYIMVDYLADKKLPVLQVKGVSIK